MVGVTMKLWGGDSDTGCCSVSDVDDARRVAQQLDIDHLVFNFAEEFDEHVVDPYVAAHAAGQHTEPVHRVQPSREVRPARRAGRPARLRRDRHGPSRARRADRRRAVHDRTRRRSGEGPELRRPHARPGPARPHDVPGRRPAEVGGPGRSPRASTCAPPTSPTARTCASSCRPAAAARRSSATASRSIGRRVVDTAGDRLGEVEAIELVTVGQRKGLGLPGGGPKRYVVDVDVDAAGGRGRRRCRPAAPRPSTSTT